MADKFHFTLLLLCSFFLLSMQCTRSHCFPFNSSSSPSLLILPLESKSLASPATNKLSFRHNVSLTVTLSVGSPPQKVTMALDTGSELSWLQCHNNSTSTAFNPNLSFSYRRIPCNSSTCTVQTRDLTNPVSCDGENKNNNRCHVALSYADATSVEGTLASETFRFGDSEPGAGLGDIVFGCVDSVSSSNQDEDSRTTGLIGLNRGSLSFVSQMGFPQFSYCISDRDSSGVLVLGKPDFPPLKLNYTPLAQIPSDHLPYFNRVAYTVQLQGIRVADTSLPIPSSILEPDHTGAGQTMMDSGTQFTFLLGPVYTALKKEFLMQTEEILRPLNDPNFVFQGAMDLCFRINETEGIPPLPSVYLIFRGAEIAVSGEKLLYKVSGGGGDGGLGVFCLTFGNSDLLGVEAYLIGHHHQQNLWVEFDLQRSRVGFAEFRCDSAGGTLGFSG